MAVEIGHFSRTAAAGGRCFMRALKGHDKVAQGKRGAGVPRAALGQRSNQFSPLPRIAQRRAIRGERSDDWGSWLPIPESRVSLFSKCFSERSVILRVG